jgi:peptidoglycan glycosyltransferase
MAMLAAGIGNDGVVMRPYVVDRIVDPDGTIVIRTKQEVLSKAVKPATARAVGAMMRAAVEVGTGQRAQIPGLLVAGKTGTAETGIQGLNTTWFICFAGRGNRPEIAVAVVVEQQNSTGGQTAAPVAKEVVQALLRGTANS